MAHFVIEKDTKTDEFWIYETDNGYKLKYEGPFYTYDEANQFRRQWHKHFNNANHDLDNTHNVRRRRHR